MNYKTLSLKPITEIPCNYDEEAENTGKVTCKDLLASPLNGNIEIKNLTYHFHLSIYLDYLLICHI